jgi:hypothetical protein
MLEQRNRVLSAVTLRNGRRRSPARRAGLLAASLAAGVAPLAVAVAGAGGAGAAPAPVLSQFNTITPLASTVPANGDVNPYGVANVPFSTGTLVRGNTLVSNFNASNNTQGTGTTIVEVAPTGHVSLFAQISPNLPGCPGGVGLTTALSVLNDGYVVVGSLPVTEQGSGTPEAGCLIVLNSAGVPVETWAGHGGRPPLLIGTAAVATGFPEELNSSALVLGPTGVALEPNGTLYVADTVHSRIAAVPFATSRFFPAPGGGFTVSQGGSLNAPLGLAVAPGGDLIAVNGNDGNAVELTPFGAQVNTRMIDPFNSGGDLFGLAIAPGGHGVLFVDDNGSANTLDLLH